MKIKSLLKKFFRRVVNVLRAYWVPLFACFVLYAIIWFFAISMVRGR